MSDSNAQSAPSQTMTNFQSFVLSLGSSAMIHLGGIPDPETKSPMVNLPLAQATIETLEMLLEKTEGNRTPEEDKTLRGMLSELRMRFVAAKK